MDKTGRNDPCPCGSGKKYKRCCLTLNASVDGFTDADRSSALDGLEQFVAKELEDEDEDASAFFYQDYEDRLDELDSEWIRASEDVCDIWFYCDWQLEDGRGVVDLFLYRNPSLGAGERRYLRLLRDTAMRLYEVADLSPGESVTLREIPAGTSVTVRERLGSRSMNRHELVAARIIVRGPSGQPEIERGLLSIPELIREQVVSQLLDHRKKYRQAHPADGEARFYKDLCPLFHEAWISSLLDPRIPRLANTDGEDMLLTRVRFEVVDPSTLESALDKANDIGRAEEGKSVWLWSGTSRQGKQVLLGRFILQGKLLELECNSAQRAERGRALVEALAGDGIRHISTIHENMAAALRDKIRSRVASRGSDDPGKPDDLPREVREDPTLDALARHYRQWLDESIPALAGRTPREAARNADLRPKLADLIHGLEGMYQKALREGDPAYDPSWMWGELGLAESSMSAHPPPLAHERMAKMTPGFGELCRTVGDQIRRRPGFEDAFTIITAEETTTNIEIQRFLRSFRCDPEPESRSSEYEYDPTSLERHILFATNFELHRRKTFWVDESLAYMLAKTDLDVLGSELRMPFPCFALVFTDRYTLSMAERMLSAGRDCPLAGHFLKVATVYVTEERGASSRFLHMGFALDALGADPPHLVEQRIPLVEDLHVRHYLDGLAPKNILSPEVPDSHPLRGLLHVVFNAILYATSVGVEPQLRCNPGSTSKRKSGPKEEPLVFSSENVTTQVVYTVV